METDSNEERNRDLKELTRQVAENNRRLSIISEAHHHTNEELDARLRRLEERNKNGHT